MKWLSTKTHKPPSSDVVIARIFRDGCVLYMSAIFQDDERWESAWQNTLEGKWDVTHFLIPDAIELE